MRVTQPVGPAAAWLFPGQGSQYVGMASEWCATSAVARLALVEASDVLGFDLERLIAAGPPEELADTYNQQPAVLAASVAILRAAGSVLPQPAVVAGHSLGEYGALVAAGSLEYADALRLVRERGRLMKLAGERRPGGMAAVLGLADEVVEEVCAELEGVQIANYNSPGQVVISGTASAVDLATSRLQGLGAKRIVRLPITIAAHSELMGSVASEFRTAVLATRLSRPSVPLVANVSARAMVGTDEIREELCDQLTASVRWTDGVIAMATMGVRAFYEVGPGAVLSALVRRILRDGDNQPEIVVSLEKPE